MSTVHLKFGSLLIKSDDWLGFFVQDAHLTFEDDKCTMNAKSSTCSDKLETKIEKLNGLYDIKVTYKDKTFKSAHYDFESFTLKLFEPCKLFQLYRHHFSGRTVTLVDSSDIHVVLALVSTDHPNFLHFAYDPVTFPDKDVVSLILLKIVQTIEERIVLESIQSIGNQIAENLGF